MKINAENLIVGRFATIAAKKALLGEKVDIINCAKAVIGGDKVFLKQDFFTKQNRGTPAKGPFFHRSPEKLVKRMIRGMLPYKIEKGRNALDRIMCFNNIPKDAKVEEYVTIESANVKKLNSTKYMYVSDICKAMGGK